MRRTTVRLVIVLVILSGLIISLMYRIVDLGVTLDFTKTELRESIDRTRILAKYQRELCTNAVQKIDGVTIFQKDENIVIQGVKFECRASPGNAPRLHVTDQ